MARAAILVTGLALVLAAAGCGSGSGGSNGPAKHARGKTLSVYVSGPRQGLEAGAGAATLAGAQRALADAGGRAGGKKVRIVSLSTTRPGDAGWDPGTVEAGADKAVNDPSTIAYVGEVEPGASAVSLPTTNREGILQVSPTDTLTSLTRRSPGKPRAGPQRYYPNGRRTFVRVAPNDLQVAAGMLGLTAGKRRIAVVSGSGIAARELAAAVTNRLRARGQDPVVLSSLRDDDQGATADAANDVAEKNPDAIVLTGSGEGSAAGFLANARRLLPAVPVFADGGLASTSAVGPRPASTQTVSPVLPAAIQPPAGRRLLRSLDHPDGSAPDPDALYGYTAMRLVLDAIDKGGSSRNAVRRAARAGGARRTPLGTLVVRPSGDAGRDSVALMNAGGPRPVFERTLRAP